MERYTSLGDLLASFQPEGTDPAPDYDAMIEDDGEDRMWCGKCQAVQQITDERGYTGFAGGNCYAWTLSCGHVIADESDDVRAAE